MFLACIFCAIIIFLRKVINVISALLFQLKLNFGSSSILVCAVVDENGGVIT